MDMMGIIFISIFLLFVALLIINSIFKLRRTQRKNREAIDAYGSRRFGDKIKEDMHKFEKMEVDINMFKKIAVAAAACIVFIVVIAMCLVVVPAGYVGVKDTFGNVDTDVLHSGLHTKTPFTAVIPFSYQTQKYYDYGQSDVATINGLSNEGLVVGMGIAVNYRIDPAMAPSLYRTVGVNYPDIVMQPPIHSVPRDIISKYDAKTLYSAGSSENPDRARIERDLYEGISRGVLDTNGNSRGVIIENVFLREIKLPQTLITAIENKLQMEQQITQKRFEVEVATEEANRKVREAQGIADANIIIADSLTDSYLKWYWLENQKTNPNVIYMLPSDEPFPFALTRDITTH